MKNATDMKIQFSLNSSCFVNNIIIHKPSLTSPRALSIILRKPNSIKDTVADH